MNFNTTQPSTMVDPRDDVPDALTTFTPWSWGSTSPFYQGENWRDYLSNGSLIREMITSGLGSNISAIRNFLLDQPSNGLLVYGASSALAQIPNSHFLASNRDLPTGWYTKDSTLRIVIPNYDDQTITRYNFVLRSQAQVLAEQFDPRIVNAGNEFIEFLEGVIPLGLIEFMDFNELGVWVLSITETTPLRPVTNNESVLEGFCRMNPDDPICNQSKGKMNTDFLGLVLAGVGVFTGNPLIVGGGLLLSFIRSRK